MPRGDGTGPMGTGTMTGRGAGYCAGFDMPGFMNPVAGPGRRMGFGRGRGRGFGRGMGRGRGGWGYPALAYPAPAGTLQEEADALKEQAKFLSETLENLNRRIAELEKDKK
jgi:hypothetical protein